MDLKKLCDKEIYSNKDIPIDIAKDILNFAESGFKEIKTSKKVANLFKSLGQKKIETEIALTGLKTTLDTGKEGPNIAVIGELDGLPVPGHPFENKENGYAHACGHHAQIGSIFTVFMGLSNKNILNNLCGKITFMAVPAEEFVEIEWRNKLRKNGQIEKKFSIKLL